MNGFVVNMFPTDLIPEILIHVPAESLARFRCTCKAWRSLIDDHRFLKLHIRRQQRDGELHVITGDTKGKFYSISLSSLASYSQNKNQRTISPKLIREPVSDTLRRPFRLSDILLTSLPMPSCDGRMLICCRTGRPWALYNPFLSEYHELPETNDSTSSRPDILQHRGGFGYDCVHDDYKVVKVSWQHNVNILSTLIYSLKSNEWHRIEDYPTNRVEGGHGVFLDGAIHWIVETKTENVYSFCILAFNLSTEKYMQLPIPRDLSNMLMHNRCSRILKKIQIYMRLDAVGEHLFISSFVRERMDVWMMQDGGENVVWTKFLSQDHLVNDILELKYNPLHLMAYEKSEEKVLIVYNFLSGDCDYKKGFWFDLVKKCSTEVPLEDLPGVLLCRGIPASLIRLTAVQEGNFSSTSMDVLEVKSERTKRKRSNS